MYVHQVKIDGGAGAGVLYANGMKTGIYVGKDSLAYWFDRKLPRGARVEVDVGGHEVHGEVVGYGTEFKGFLKRIIRELPRPEATHILTTRDGDVYLLFNPIVPSDATLERYDLALLSPLRVPNITAEAYMLVATQSNPHTRRPGTQPVPGGTTRWEYDGEFPVEGATMIPVGSR